MNKFLGFTAVLALLAACNESPSGAVVDPEEPVVDPEDPPVVDGGATRAGNLEAATFVPGATPTLTLQIEFDGDMVDQVYTHIQTLANGYEVFARQEGTNGRSFTALAGSSSDGLTTGVVVSDGSKFNSFDGGALISQGAFSAPTASDEPTAGNHRYSGSYVGLVNFGTKAHDGIADLDGSAAYNASRVEGDGYIIADFRGGALAGGIYNRLLFADNPDTVTVETNIPLIDVILVPGTIAADGTFTGTAEDVDQGGMGTYSGAFSGTGATSLGGILELGAGFLDGSDVADLGGGNENEYGIFILNLQ